MQQNIIVFLIDVLLWHGHFVHYMSLLFMATVVMRTRFKVMSIHTLPILLYSSVSWGNKRRWSVEVVPSTVALNTVLVNNIMRYLQLNNVLVNNIMRYLQLNNVLVNNIMRYSQLSTVLVNNMWYLQLDTVLVNNIMQYLQLSTVWVNNIMRYLQFILPIMKHLHFCHF